MAFTFGQTQPPAFGAAPATSTSFGFGSQPAASAAPTFGFSTQTSAAAAPSFGFGTQTSTAAAPSFGFGTQTSTAAAPLFGFGSQTSTAPAAGTGTLSFGTGLGGFGTSQPSTLSFGTAPAVGSQAPSLGLGGFGQQTGFGLTGTQPASSAGFTLGGFSQPTTTASAGLGGVTTTLLGGGLSTATGSQGKQDVKAIKENTVPSEINQSIEDFKKFVKDQKIKKEEVARGSEKGLEKVSQEIEALRKLLATLASGVQRHASLANKLKYDVALEFQNVEIAQRTKETAASMQIDNVAPLKYFFRLVTSFEENMQAYRQQIDEIERDLTALSRQQSLTPQELTNGLKKIHEALISLASKVYAVHSSLQNFKETYLDFRRRYHGDTTDIFAARKSGSAPMRAAAQIPSANGAAKNITGPAPFSGSAGGLSRTLASLNGSTNQGNISGLMGSSSAGNVSGSTGGGLSLFGGSAGSSATGFGLLGGNSQTLQSAENRSFQLQSPPPGNKRNKR